MNWIRHFTHAGLLDVTVIANIFLVYQRWNLKNLSRGLNPPKPGLNEAPA